jgi:hypothetical protein
MALKFHGKDPENPGNNCPAVFRDDPEMLARISVDSPLLDSESVVKLPARMVEIILEACRAGVVR